MKRGMIWMAMAQLGLVIFLSLPTTSAKKRHQIDLSVRAGGCLSLEKSIT